VEYKKRERERVLSHRPFLALWIAGVLVPTVRSWITHLLSRWLTRVGYEPKMNWIDKKGVNFDLFELAFLGVGVRRREMGGLGVDLLSRWLTRVEYSTIRNIVMD